MVDESKIKYRLERAQECLTSAEADIKLGHLYSAANRSYYAVYCSIRAVNALKNFTSMKHSGNIAEFRRCYTKTRIFDARFSKIIDELQELRENCDYEDYFIIELPKVTLQLENAKCFYQEIKKYIETYDIFN